MWRERLIFVQHLFNEIAIYTSCILLTLFSPIVGDMEIREVLGLIYLGVLALTIVVNIVVILVYASYGVVRACRRMCAYSEKPAYQVANFESTSFTTERNVSEKKALQGERPKAKNSYLIDGLPHPVEVGVEELPPIGDDLEQTLKLKRRVALLPDISEAESNSEFEVSQPESLQSMKDERINDSSSISVTSQ